MLVVHGFDELETKLGQEIAKSAWVTVTQAQVDLFAQATGDHQWIHTDPIRAKQGPFGMTIAHGFLTLSLMPQFFASAISISSVRMGINYGLNKVRFTAPVPVGSRLQATLTPQQLEKLPDSGYQTTWDVVVHREGVSKPVCIAQLLVRQYL
jgi:acyl dehydratase